MEIERHEPVPAPTFTLKVTQRELDLIVVAVDRAGTVSGDPPAPLNDDLQYELDTIFMGITNVTDGGSMSENRLGVDV